MNIITKQQVLSVNSKTRTHYIKGTSLAIFIPLLLSASMSYAWSPFSGKPFPISDKTIHTNQSDTHNANTQTKTENLTPYQSINIQAVANVTINKSSNNDYKTTLSGTESEIKNIKMEVTNGILLIQNKNSHKNPQELHINLQTPELNTVTYSGVGNIDINGPFVLSKVQIEGAGNVKIKGIQSDDFHLLASGTGTISIKDLNSKTCNITSDGVGNVSINGTCGLANLNSTNKSLGNLDASGLKTQKLDIKKQGIGNIIRP